MMNYERKKELQAVNRAYGAIYHSANYLTWKFSEKHWGNIY